MAFDMGFDFRDTAGFVTDPSYAVPGSGKHIHTPTQIPIGYSVNAGWDSAPSVENDLNTNDPRLAGLNYGANAGVVKTFTVDLSSGSAPGAGTYAIDLAAGYMFGVQVQDFKVLDNSTVLIDGTGGGSGLTTIAGHWIDATLADVIASNTWTGTPAIKSFATTTAKLAFGYDTTAHNTTLAHFRLTLQTANARLSSFFPFFVPGLLSTPS